MRAQFNGLNDLIGNRPTWDDVNNQIRDQAAMVDTSHSEF